MIVDPHTGEVNYDMINPDTGFEEDELENEFMEEGRPRTSPFILDKWEHEQGRRLAEVEKPKWTHSNDRPADLIYADSFAASFRQYPEIEQECVHKRKEEFFRTLLDSPDFQNLHRSTAANMMASEMSAVQIANQLYEMSDEDEARKDTKQYENASDEDKQLQDEIGLLSAVSKAVREATKEVEEMQAMCDAYGLDPGTGGEVSKEHIRQQLHKVKSDHQLKRIIELAGRYRLSAQATQRNKVKHGYDDMVGVELGNDIGRVLPVELAKLADDDLGDDVLRRFAERQLILRSYEGREPQAKGPVVVCVDESGSMAGERIAQAKAFCLAMMWIAKKQKRQCILVSFSCGHDCKWVSNESKNLGTWLSHFYNGGTDLDVPCIVVPKHWKETFKAKEGKTDMIIVTDAVLSIGEGMKQNFLRWKKENDVHVQTIVVGTNNPGSMGEISESVHVVQCMDVQQESTQLAFSI